MLRVWDSWKRYAPSSQKVISIASAWYHLPLTECTGNSLQMSSHNCLCQSLLKIRWLEFSSDWDFYRLERRKQWGLHDIMNPNFLSRAVAQWLQNPQLWLLERHWHAVCISLVDTIKISCFVCPTYVFLLSQLFVKDHINVCHAFMGQSVHHEKKVLPNLEHGTQAFITWEYIRRYVAYVCKYCLLCCCYLQYTLKSIARFVFAWWVSFRAEMVTDLAPYIIMQFTSFLSCR